MLRAGYDFPRCDVSGHDCLSYSASNRPLCLNVAILCRPHFLFL
jgi:hypothetical protein